MSISRPPGAGGGAFDHGFFRACVFDTVERPYTFNCHHPDSGWRNGWMAGWVDGGMGGRRVRYGRMGGRRDGHKGGVKGPLLMK